MRVCVFTNVYRHPSAHPVLCGNDHVLSVREVWKWLLNRGNWVVSQISDIKRQKARLEVMKKEAEEERQRAREAARERVLSEFEKGQLGLAASSMISTSSRLDSSADCTSLSIFFPYAFVLRLL